MPEVDISLVGGAQSNKCIDVKALVDSGSTFNLVSRSMALAMERRWSTTRLGRAESDVLPSVRVANGEMVKATKCMELRVAREGRKDFFFFFFFFYTGQFITTARLTLAGAIV